MGDGGPESVPRELTETGELDPLSLDRLPDDIDHRSGIMTLGTCGSGSVRLMARTGSSWRLIDFARGRGVGPWSTTMGRWNAGRGREGSVCFGCLREGNGPVTRRRGVGGGRRGMVHHGSS